MDIPYEPPAGDATTIPWNWTRVFLLLAASLTATVGYTEYGFEVLRIGGIQYLELVYLFQVCLIVLLFPRHKFQTRMLRPAFTLGLLYAIILVAALVLSLVALRNDFYLPSGLPTLRHPVWITLSRMTELFVDVSAMLYLIHLFRENINNLIFALRVYFWVGVASAIWAMATFPLNYFYNFNLGTYHDDHRMRGFYNEGGSYGLYLLSVICVAFILSRRQWLARSRIRFAYILLGIAWVDSQSKAAIVAASLILIFNAFMVKEVGRRVAVLASLLGLIYLASLVPQIRDSTEIYITAPAKYEYLSSQEGHEDLLSGRIAGAFIVRRMIAVHPFIGIGWGNYPLVRNSPEYRGGAGWADFFDDPGLGILGATADFGIPLMMFIIGVTFYPYFYLRRRGATLAIKNLALIQPIVHLCGAQLNLTYPWLITAFALALGYYHIQDQGLAVALLPAGSGPTPQPLPALVRVEAP